MTHNTDRQETAILIAGPTASGKSALAMELAEAENGVVINADSMQVYRELRVLTARPSDEDEARLPHRLYGHVPGADGYSAGRYCKDAAAAIAAAQGEGQKPIIVGGTGLYFRALLGGLSPIPEIAPDVRSYWRGQGETLGPKRLHDELTRRDPEMASRLRPTDPQRLMRALEVLDSTGRSLADWQKQPGTPVLDGARCRKLIVLPERDLLYARCDQRFDMMLENGAVPEVQALLQLQLNPDLPIMRALGVRPIKQYIAGEITREDAVTFAKTETRQFAKRQMTWLRRNMCDWKMVPT